MVECAGLEIRYTFRRIVGSNPTLSARYQKPLNFFRGFFFADRNSWQRRGQRFFGNHPLCTYPRDRPRLL